MNNKNKKPIIFYGTFFAVAACFLLIAATGCEEAAVQKSSAAEQIQRLKEEKRQLQSQIEQTRQEKKQLERQVQLLSELPADVRLKNLYSLQKIKLTRYTGLYDKDKDGINETLIVYIQPIDEDNDVIKAAGAVDVQLWNLNKPSGEAMLGEWSVGPQELKRQWLATLVTTNYRLAFDVAGKVEDNKDDLTVKVTFTDYLSGKVFTEQEVIKRD